MDRKEAAKEIDRVYASLEKRNHFQLLGVNPETPPAQLKLAFHTLAKKWHADNYAGLQLGARQRKLDEIFQRIGEAYETLSTQSKREEYMLALKREEQGLSNDVNAILRAEGLVDEAIADIRRKRWDSAIEQLEEARRLNRDDPLYDVHLAWAIYNKDRDKDAAVKQARGLLEGAVKRQQALPQAYNYLGQIAFAKNQNEDAKKWFKRCLSWDRKNVEALRGIRLINAREEKANSGLAGLFKKLMGK